MTKIRGVHNNKYSKAVAITINYDVELYRCFTHGSTTSLLFEHYCSILLLIATFILCLIIV